MNVKTQKEKDFTQTVMVENFKDAQREGGSVGEDDGGRRVRTEPNLFLFVATGR